MEELEAGQKPDLAQRLAACSEDTDADLDWIDELPGEDIVRAMLSASEMDPSFKLEMHVSNPLARRLLTVFSQARQVLTGAEFDAAWERLSFSMDVSVWGGDPFLPVLLPNGTLLVRNHHRVIGIADTPSAVIYGSRARLKRDVGQVLKQARKRDPAGSFLIHRRENGAVVRTRRLPRKLSETGQSILFVNHEIALKRMKALTANLLEPVMSSSRAGRAVLRFFGDHVFVYATHRFDDALDVLLEEFAEAYLTSEDENEPIQAQITPEATRLLETVSSRVRPMLENEENLGVEKQDVMFHHLNKSITEPSWGSYTGRKVADMMRLPAFFAASADRPSGYNDSYTSDAFDLLKSRVWQLSQRYGLQAAVLFIPLNALARSYNDLGDVSAERVERALAPLLAALGTKALYAPANALLEVQHQSLRAFEAAGELGKLKNRACAAVETALAAAGEGLAEDEVEDAARDAIGYGEDYELAVILLPKKKSSKVDLPAWDQEVRLLSGRIEGAVSLHFPRFGLLQSYDRGDDDSGNAFHFTVEAADGVS